MFDLERFWGDLLPSAVADGEISACFRGNKRIWIENFIGLCRINDDEIVLKGRRKNMKIRGNGLCIEYFTRDSLEIRGEFESITWESLGRGN